MVVSQKAHPILLTLLKIQQKYKKDYSFPTQAKLLNLLCKFQQIKKSRATLNRWLRSAEDAKFLIRRRRIKRDPLYGTVFKSTLYKISIKGYRLLSRFGVAVQEEINKYEKWQASVKPQKEKTAPALQRQSGLNRLGDLELIQDFLGSG